MKVILLQNVPKLGQKDDIKDVSDGYARNVLLARKLAKFVTFEDIKKAKNNKDSKGQKTDLIQKKAEGLIRQISGKEIHLKEKVNEKGHLFAQVHLKEIADAIGTLGYDISEDWIVLEKPIKEAGEIIIQLKAYDQKGEIKLFIESE